MTTTVIAEVQDKAERARAAALKLAEMTRAEKDRVLLAMADAIEARSAEILAANAQDVENVQQKGGAWDGVLGRIEARRVLDNATAPRYVALRPLAHMEKGAALRDAVGQAAIKLNLSTSRVYALLKELREGGSSTLGRKPRSDCGKIRLPEEVQQCFVRFRLDPKTRWCRTSVAIRQIQRQFRDLSPSEASLRHLDKSIPKDSALIDAAWRALSEYLKAKATPVDRLMLNEKRVTEMAAALREVAALPDPVGEVLGGGRVQNGLEITKVRVPLGVIGIIYESRPNVTVDAASLCLKSGNATILRGGSDAILSNICLVNIITEAGEKVGLPAGAIQLIETTDREAVGQLIRMDKYIDVLIPRGGHDLIQRTKREATIPVIETGEGLCHIFVDASADGEMAENITINAKCQRPSVCNSAETLLVHKDIAAEFLPRVGRALIANGVEVRACERSLPYMQGASAATEEDWATEYLALIISVKVVDSVEEAIAHINRYSTRHSDSIITRDLVSAQRFTRGVDSAAVYVNASTRFTDGGEFGFGAEIGISNQKLHARGPMGLPELTSYKYVIVGDGQVRG